MISYPFFELFSVEARVFAATLNYTESNPSNTKTKVRARHENVCVCPLGACCYYDKVIPPSFTDFDGTKYYAPIGTELDDVLGVTYEEISDFITQWDRGNIPQEDLALVMGLT